MLQKELRRTWKGWLFVRGLMIAKGKGIVRHNTD